MGGEPSKSAEAEAAIGDAPTEQETDAANSVPDSEFGLTARWLQVLEDEDA
jgi:hypothetical protein